MIMNKIKILALAFLGFGFASCSENYSVGERIGVITQFSKTGIVWKSFEGHLNVTQTGMNSSVPFDFSIDNDAEPLGLVKTLDSAARYGWKVKLNYHEVSGWNMFQNRGNTDHFVTQCEVLEKDFGNVFNGKTESIGRVVDTIYVVIDKSK